MESITSESGSFEIIDELDAVLGADEIAKIQAWLQPTDYQAESSEYHRHLTSQAPGTGLWLCETSQFQQWHDSEHHGSLWLKGSPGAGKSVIASSIIDHLASNENVPVLFFFFRYIIAANRRPRGAIQDFLAQLLPFSLSLQTELQAYSAGDLDEVSDERLWECFMAGLASVEKLYCVVDALDEMEALPTDPFFDRLNSLATFRPENIKLLMTSRPKQYLQSSLKDAAIVHVNLEESLVGKDIALFTSFRLSNAFPGSHNQRLRDSLSLIICQRSRGLFLYSRLLIDQVIPTLHSVRESDVVMLASSLPVGLEDMYNSMLCKQAELIGIDQEIQLFILELVTHSSRALRLNELASALTFVSRHIGLPGTSKQIARGACAPLLEVLEDETIQVIHHSFTEYLLETSRVLISSHGSANQFPILKPLQIHKRVATTCIAYLQSGVLEEQEPVITVSHCLNGCDLVEGCICEQYQENSDRIRDAKLNHPFLDYAIRNWSYHCGMYDVDDEDFFNTIAIFLDPDNVDFQKWLLLAWTSKTTLNKRQMPTPLHVASFAGMMKYAVRLISMGSLLEAVDFDNRTPLHWACRRGHSEIVCLLLQNGANSDAEDCRGIKPIHEAAKRNFSGIVTMLLNAGVNPLSPKTKENHSGRIRGGGARTRGDTAVEYACQQGHTETILAMIPFLQSATLEEVLGECCLKGKFEAVQAVLDNTSVDPNSKFCGATAIYHACQSLNVKCVELLLEKGADVSIASNSSYWWRKRGRSMGGQQQNRLPIHVVAQELGRSSVAQKILHMLLEAGAEIDAKTESGQTALTQLFRAGSKTEVTPVRILLDMGAKATPELLHSCVSTCRNIEILELVLARGVDVNVPDVRGNTALHILFSRAYIRNNDEDSFYKTVQFLLSKGSKPDILNEDRRSALQIAIRTAACDIDTFRLLLQACPNPVVRQSCFWSLDSRMNVEEAVTFAQELLAAGAALEDKNAQGQTVLLASVRSDNAFKALARCGANVNAVDLKCRGVLHHFVASYNSRHSPQRLDEFVAMGMDPLIVDREKNTLLHVYADGFKGTKGEVQLVQKLISYGVDANAKNSFGETALHTYLERMTTGFTDHQPNEKSFQEVVQKCQYDFDVNAQDLEGVSPLHLAGLTNEVQVCQLLAAGADPSVTTSDGRTVLHIACRARQSNIVVLLASKAKTLIHSKDRSGRSPLHDACTSGRPESVWALLEAGADINATDELGRTALHACSEFESEKQLWNILRLRNEAAGQYHKPDRWRPRPGIARAIDPWYSFEPALHYSPSIHDTARIGPIIEMLITSDADVHKQDLEGVLPLDLAIMSNCTEMIQLLHFTVFDYEKAKGLSPENHILATLVALKSSRSLETFPDPIYERLLQHPQTYLALLTPNEILIMLSMASSMATLSNDHGVDFMCEAIRFAASQGLSEVLELLGTRVSELLEMNLLELEHETKPILHTACSRRMSNLQVIDILIRQCGVDVNQHAMISIRGPTGQKHVPGPTALHVLACAESWWHIDAIKLLVERGANINALDDKGQTPLQVASFENKSDVGMGQGLGGNSFFKLEAVKTLLELGADPDILDGAGHSCLSKVDSSPEITRLLLQYSSKTTAKTLTSALLAAIRTQDADTLAILIDAGANVHSIDTDEEFPLHYLSHNHTRYALFCACYPDSMNLVKRDFTPVLSLLLKSGADPYFMLNKEEMLIHFVFMQAEYEIVSSILKILREGAVEIDFEKKDSHGMTILLAACNWGQCLPGYRHAHWVPKVQAPFIELLDFNVDTMAVDTEERHMLHHLLDNPDMEVDSILYCLSLPAAKNLILRKDKQGYSPLHCALQCLRPALCEVLLGMGANLMEADPDGETALHQVAAQCLKKYVPRRINRLRDEQKPDYQPGLLALWRKYLQQGGDINARSNEGFTPLLAFLASSVDHGDDIQDLSHVGYYSKLFDGSVVDVQARNNDGETALHVIAKREREAYTSTAYNATLFAFMVKKGLDPLAEDNDGRSALDVAAACEQIEILKMYRFGKP